MSDYLNGYVEWRGRDTLLKSQFGILDKVSGEHLVPVTNPEEFFDPDDMDIVTSVPNIKPTYPAQLVVPKPKITFGESEAVGDADLDFATGLGTVRATGNIKLFKSTEIGEAYATFNGGYKTSITPDTDGDFDVEIEIELKDWKSENNITIFTCAIDSDNGGDNGPFAMAVLPIAIKAKANSPSLVVNKFLNVKFDEGTVYEFPNSLARMDIAGRLTVAIRTDKVDRVWVVVDNDDEFDAILVHGIDDNGYPYADWTASIPSKELDKLGRTPQRVIVYARSKGDEPSVAVHQYCNFYRK